MLKKILILIAIVLTPYLIGKFQMYNANLVIQNITERTDGEIENVLTAFNFDLDWYQEPTVKDYYISGLVTLKEIAL